MPVQSAGRAGRALGFGLWALGLWALGFGLGRWALGGNSAAEARWPKPKSREPRAGSPKPRSPVLQSAVTSRPFSIIRLDMTAGGLKALEFDRVVAAVRSFALTATGAARLGALRPATDQAVVREALAATSEAVSYLASNPVFPLRAPEDLET